jgi:hypothetical protein
MKNVIQIVCAVVVVVGLGSAAMALEIETVPVGNAGNGGDPSTPSRYGAVDYEYNIGKYEVTAGQYTEFLNAVAALDTYGLYNYDMRDISRGHEGCNIRRSGLQGNYTYSVAPDWANRPVNFVSWGDAARFANWMHNGQPIGVQDPSTTEDGAYFLNGATSDMRLLAVSREADWKWALPTDAEWYKPAYHKNDGATNNYFAYPTSSDTVPGYINDIGDFNRPGDGSFTEGGADPGNYATHDGDGGIDGIGDPYYRTEVGEHENSASPYGTFDQGGNVSEWNERKLSNKYRASRGGWYFEEMPRSYSVDDANPKFESRLIGFRLVRASIPLIPPTADADGSYTIWEGDPLILNASLTEKGDYRIASYVWDLDDDGVFETDAGDQPFLMVNYGDLEGLGLTVGGIYDIHLLVTDSTGMTDTDSSSLRVVPEPATLGMLALGGLAILRRRKCAGSSAQEKERTER